MMDIILFYDVVALLSVGTFKVLGGSSTQFIRVSLTRYLPVFYLLPLLLGPGNGLLCDA